MDKMLKSNHFFELKIQTFTPKRTFLWLSTWVVLCMYGQNIYSWLKMIFCLCRDSKHGKTHEGKVLESSFCSQNVSIPNASNWLDFGLFNLRNSTLIMQKVFIYFFIKIFCITMIKGRLYPSCKICGECFPFFYQVYTYIK